MRELTAFARDARRRSDVPAVVLSGGGAVFSAGYDLTESAARMAEPQPPTLLRQREQLALGPDLCQAWEEIEAITIAAIEGPCLGGACALALACDFRIAGIEREHPVARGAAGHEHELAVAAAPRGR